MPGGLPCFRWMAGTGKASLDPPMMHSWGLPPSLSRRRMNCASAVDLILGQTLIVRDRAAARRLVRELPPHARVVTLRGEVFRGDGLIIAGRSASRASVLSRPRQKRELGEALAASETQIDLLNSEVDTLSAGINEAQRELAQADEQVQAARSDWRSAGNRAPGRTGSRIGPASAGVAEESIWSAKGGGG